MECRHSSSSYQTIIAVLFLYGAVWQCQWLVLSASVVTARYERRLAERLALNLLVSVLSTTTFIDWGLEHNRVQSLIYSQLWDMGDAFDISMNGTVTVKPDDVTRPCEFQYNYWN